MAKSCGTQNCNRQGLWMCRGCRDWFCIHYIGKALDCVAPERDKRGTAVCWWCDKEGVK